MPWLIHIEQRSETGCSRRKTLYKAKKVSVDTKRRRANANISCKAMEDPKARYLFFSLFTSKVLLTSSASKLTRTIFRLCFSGCSLRKHRAKLISLLTFLYSWNTITHPPQSYYGRRKDMGHQLLDYVINASHLQDRWHSIPMWGWTQNS